MLTLNWRRFIDQGTKTRDRRCCHRLGSTILQVLTTFHQNAAYAGGVRSQHLLPFEASPCRPFSDPNGTAREPTLHVRGRCAAP